MKTTDIVEIDRDISRLEKQLSKMYMQRLSLLESEIEASRARAESLGGEGVAPSMRSAAVEAIERVATSARKAVKGEGRGRGKGKGKGTGQGKKKRTRMSTEEVEKRLVDTVKAGGDEGLSLKAISDSAGVNYQTTAKKLKEMSDRFEKRGELKDARYVLKG